MTYEDRVKNKCKGLLKLITGIQKFYKSANDENKRFIETTIGAAIWYLPKDNTILFTGKISKEAIKKKEKSEDHLYPRKIAAKELLNIDWDKKDKPVDDIASLFIKKYGKFNYVSKSENKKLIKFQKSEIFKSSEKAYNDAGVELVDYN
tara:strand:+ start:86 stop:532 length:447 start_codon:yes stop_codon:yes gene_type:complete